MRQDGGQAPHPALFPISLPCCLGVSHPLSLPPQECDNPCCNAANCTLREGAECAHGSCCDGCKVRARPAPSSDLTARGSAGAGGQGSASVLGKWWCQGFRNMGPERAFEQSLPFSVFDLTEFRSSQKAVWASWRVGNFFKKCPERVGLILFGVHNIPHHSFD